MGQFEVALTFSEKNEACRECRAAGFFYFGGNGNKEGIARRCAQMNGVALGAIEGHIYIPVEAVNSENIYSTNNTIAYPRSMPWVVVQLYEDTHLRSNA